MSCVYLGMNIMRYLASVSLNLDNLISHLAQPVCHYTAERDPEVVGENHSFLSELNETDESARRVLPKPYFIWQKVRSRFPFIG